MTTYLTTALAWYDAGACVIRAGHQKKPIGSWTNYQTQRPSREQVSEWFNDPASLGLGIVCGAVSGNLEMLEIEGRAVRDGAVQALAQDAIALGLSDLLGKLFGGYKEDTPSGGIHFIYRITDHAVPGNTKIAQNRDREVLAETRGTGGFVVIAPTAGIDTPNGKTWTTDRGPANVIDLTWQERNDLHAIFRTLDALPDETDTRPVHTGDTTGSGDRPGDHYAQNVTWEQILEPHGWSKVFTRNDVTHWRRPGKTEGTSATTGFGERGNLHIFTTSTIFALGSHSKFAAYAVLNHHGNYAEAARALAAEGYGTPREALNPLTEAPHPDLAPAPVKQAPEAQDGAPVDEEDDDSTWKPVNLTPYWQGTVTRPNAGIIHREDGPGLLYPGRVHSFYGESESGKSWLAQIVVAHTLISGHQAIYIDFEADAEDIVTRLKLLGVTSAHAANLTYLRPEAARDITDPYWQSLLQSPARLIIIDGVTEALTMWGGETKDNDKITTWTRKFPRALARATGAAVVTIDHVPKDKETRGRFAIGGQAKLASIDGAAYLIEPLEPLAPGRIGRLTVRVTKDRPGSVRAVAGMWRKSDRTQEATVAVIDASGEQIQWRLVAPLSEEEAAAIRVDTMRQNIIDVMLNLDHTVSGNDIAKKVGGTRDPILEAIRVMKSTGEIIEVQRGQLRLSDAIMAEEGRPLMPFTVAGEAS